MVSLLYSLKEIFAILLVSHDKDLLAISDYIYQVEGENVIPVNRRVEIHGLVR